MTTNHYAGIIRQVRDRIEEILIECEVLIEEVMGENLDGEGQDVEVPRIEGEIEPIEKDPEEDLKEEEPWK